MATKSILQFKRRVACIFVSEELGLSTIPILIYMGASFLSKVFPQCGPPSCLKAIRSCSWVYFVTTHWQKRWLIGLRLQPDATLPTGTTRAFVSLSVVSTRCFRTVMLKPIHISSSKIPYPYGRILESAIFLSWLRSQLNILAMGLNIEVFSTMKDN